jgi:hypothetical protein
MTEPAFEPDPLAAEVDVPPTLPYDEGKETDIPEVGEPGEDHPVEEVPF